jgi:hypothetical protein
MNAVFAGKENVPHNGAVFSSLNRFNVSRFQTGVVKKKRSTEEIRANNQLLILGEKKESKPNGEADMFFIGSAVGGHLEGTPAHNK